MNKYSKVLRFSDLQIGLEQTITFKITENDLERFEELSGDRNPLHKNSDFAKNKGFQEKVVYGALLIAKLSQLVGMYLPGRDSILTGLDIKFRAPVYPGDIVALTGTIVCLSHATSAVNLSVSGYVGDRKVLSGKAETVIRE